MSTATAPVKTEAQRLKDARYEVKKYAFLLKRHWASDQVLDAIKCAASMAAELKTNSLSPDNYYALYMAVFQELNILQEKLVEKYSEGGPALGQLYDVVQYAGNILPRLYVHYFSHFSYLMITLGAALIRTETAPCEDVLKDLLIMCKGVQHPMRGLFLRQYLSQVMKDKLPDKGNIYTKQGATVSDSVDFVISNFVEMNRLWVRMQHLGSRKGALQRRQQREKLKLLVGTNLVRLSQLEGIDLDSYAVDILPPVFQQILDCKDPMAQQYLMECVIAVFPDEFHINTLDPLLNGLTRLEDGVDVRSHLNNLVTRFCRYAKQNRENIPDDDLAVFPQFYTHVNQLILPSTQTLATVDAEGNSTGESNTIVKEPRITTLEPAVDLIKQLMFLITKLIPHRADFTDHVLATQIKVLNYHVAKSSGDDQNLVNPSASSEDQAKLLRNDPDDAVQTFYEMLDECVGHFGKHLNLLSQLRHLSSLIEVLPLVRRCRIATKLITVFLESGQYLSTVEETKDFLVLLKPLLKDSPTNDSPVNVPGRPPEVSSSYVTSSSRETKVGPQYPKEYRRESRFQFEQESICRLFHRIRGETPDVTFTIYTLLGRVIFNSGAKRMKYTLPALIKCVLSFAVKLRKSIATLQRRHMLAVENAKKNDHPPPDEPTLPQVDSKRAFRFVHGMLTKVFNEELLTEDEEIEEPDLVSDPNLYSLKSEFSRRNGDFDHGHLDDSDMLDLLHISQRESPPKPTKSPPAPIMIYQLFVFASNAATICHFDPVSFEFLTFAFQAFDQILEAKDRYSALDYLLGTLAWQRWENQKNRTSLTTNAASHVSRLVNKHQKTCAFLALTHVFHQPTPGARSNPITSLGPNDTADQSPSHVLTCLQRAVAMVKTINSMDPTLALELGLDILNSYIFYLTERVSSINPQDVKNLIDLVASQRGALDSGTSTTSTTSTSTDLFGDDAGISTDFLGASVSKKKKKKSSALSKEQIILYYQNTIQKLPSSIRPQ